MSRTVIQVEIKGLKELEKKLKKIDADVRKKIALNAVNAGAAVIERKAKINMDKKLRRRTGNLINSIGVKSRIVKDGAEARISVGGKYGRIHEFGGVIVPKKAKLLAWKGANGNMIFAKKVVMPARPYLKPAINENEDEIRIMMEIEVVKGIARSRDG